MSFWVLEDENMQERAFVIPLVGDGPGGMAWRAILRYRRVTLWLMLVTTVGALLFTVAAGIFMTYLALSLFTGDAGQAVGCGLAAVLLGWGALKMLQSSVRLGVYLKRRKGVT